MGKRMSKVLLYLLIGFVIWFFVIMVTDGIASGRYSELLGGAWVIDELGVPAARGHRRFERNVEHRMRVLHEDRATAEKNVEAYYRHRRENPD